MPLTLEVARSKRTVPAASVIDPANVGVSVSEGTGCHMGAFGSLSERDQFFRSLIDPASTRSNASLPVPISRVPETVRPEPLASVTSAPCMSTTLLTMGRSDSRVPVSEALTVPALSEMLPCRLKVVPARKGTPVRSRVALRSVLLVSVVVEAFIKTT